MTSSAIRIAMLTTAHPWNDPRIYQKESRSLAASGFDVTLIAQQTPASPIDAVEFETLPVPSSRLNRMLVLSLVAFRRSLKYDVIHFHDPEFIPSAIALKILGKKIIYDVHEDLPRQILIKHWIPSFLRNAAANIAELFEQVAALFFNRIVAATPTIAARFPAKKTIIVKNYPIISEDDAPLTPYEERDPDFIYAGVITEERGANIMIEAFSELKNPKSHLHFAGRMTTPEIEKNIRLTPGTVIHGIVDEKSLTKIYALCRVGLVILKPTQNYIDSLPTKMFEYMLAGMPVIASNFKIWADILNDARAGILVDPTNSPAITAAMQWLLENPKEAAEMGARGRNLVLKNYQWAFEANKLSEMYSRL